MTDFTNVVFGAPDNYLTN